ncbi:class I SAM-dependent methyltransferase [Polynucleobacter paludilacus]|jgi:precorrin-6B methylase 2|uniref:SAM-dependent methyltransferase n=1 Tax=Polynucleobacter paludilacus TaxID=1855895 RepID=UPI001BFE73DC|nr:class I SAM-dependent methyltransferase [Polynucleobacter paludilacus]QWD48447.1 class I SAM-dependent methyltransferase [Polynucleobacter paneuropaeus]QWD87755.1 class I SAM-dependent methyltransferase [Polynucleobacter paludilacus]
MPPAFTALLILCFSGILTFIAQTIVDFGLHLTLPNGLLFLLQGLIAAGLAKLLKMQVWWPYILLIFPLAVWLGLIFRINPLFYLVGFVLFASLYWSVFLTQVPYYPSSESVCILVAEMLPPDQKQSVVEIGSGLGGFSLKLAHLRPQCTVLGMEIAPLPWLISYLRSKFQKSLVRFRLGNYKTLDFSDFDLIFAYLSPAAMPSLYEQCSMQMKPGAILVSHEFPIPDIEPTRTLQSETGNKTSFIYEIQTR